jgi:thioredoxin 1
MKELKTPGDFADKVLDEKTGIVVVDFFANWCGPCMRIAPRLEIMDKEMDNISFYKIDADNQDMEEIMSICGASSLPTFVFFNNGVIVKEGNKVKQVVGANEDSIRRTIKQIEKLNEKRDNSSE